MAVTLSPVISVCPCTGACNLLKVKTSIKLTEDVHIQNKYKNKYKHMIKMNTYNIIKTSIG